MRVCFAVLPCSDLPLWGGRLYFYLCKGRTVTRAGWFTSFCCCPAKMRGIFFPRAQSVCQYGKHDARYGCFVEAYF